MFKAQLVDARLGYPSVHGFNPRSCPQNLQILVEICLEWRQPKMDPTH